MSDLQLVRMLLHDTMLDRAKRKLPAEFPFTGGHVQRMARRRGYLVGEARALGMVKLLIDSGEIVRCGSYRQAYLFRAGAGAFRVQLFRLPGTLLRKASASIRRPRPVKRKKRRPYALSWAHPLFGMPDGRPPPEWKRKRDLRKRGVGEALDELLPWWDRSAWE